MRTLLGKELLDLRRNRGALLPVVLVTLVTIAMPFGLTLIIPALTGIALSDDADIARLTERAASGRLDGEARVQLVLFEQFLVLLLLTPITGAMVLASHSVVGEKLSRTLEPLLATPLTTTELLLAKVLGAFVPTMAVWVTGLLLFGLALALFAAPGVLAGMLSTRTAALLLLGPAAALVAIQVALIISSRANDPRTAQQFAGLIILPVIGVFIAQFAGMVQLSGRAIGLAALATLGTWVLLALLGARLFRREAILTRWR